jgi:hypothetical protein
MTDRNTCTAADSAAGGVAATSTPTAAAASHDVAVCNSTSVNTSISTAMESGGVVTDETRRGGGGGGASDPPPADATKTFSKKVLTSAVQSEAELQDISAKHDFSPWTRKITPFVNDDKFSIFEMEAVNGKSIYYVYGDDPADVPLYVWNQIRFILQYLWDEEGIEYVDITSYNFMIDEDEKVWVIDFGDASYAEAGKRNWFHEEFLDGTNSWNPDFK